jgi:hypothetical protein
MTWTERKGQYNVYNSLLRTSYIEVQSSSEGQDVLARANNSCEGYNTNVGFFQQPPRDSSSHAPQEDNIKDDGEPQKDSSKSDVCLS